MKNKNLVKAAALLAAIVMSVSLLAACAEAQDPSAAGQVSSAVTEDAGSETAEQPVDYVDEEETIQQLAQLDDVLASIRENVQIGTAGASLKTAREAVNVMQWSVNTPLSDAQIEAFVTDYISGLTEDEAAEFEMQLMAVDSTCQLLLEGGQEDLMSDAGISATDIPFGSDSIDALESIMKAAGLR